MNTQQVRQCVCEFVAHYAKCSQLQMALNCHSEVDFTCLNVKKVKVNFVVPYGMFPFFSSITCNVLFHYLHFQLSYTDKYMSTGATAANNGNKPVAEVCMCTYDIIQNECCSHQVAHLHRRAHSVMTKCFKICPRLLLEGSF